MSVQDRINDYWSGRAGAYDDHQRRPDRFEDDQRAWGRIWTDALPAAPADVLDLGTGSGYVALLLAQLGHRVTGIDLAEPMLQRARGHAADLPSGVRAPEFRPGDAVRPDFPDGSFDAVVGRYVAWTLRQPRDAASAWLRLLRPGGTLALVDSTWFPDGIDERESMMAGHYDAEVRAALPLHDASSIDATAATVRAAGFTDVRVVPLTDVLELDRRYGVAPNHEVQLQYLVHGRRPG